MVPTQLVPEDVLTLADVLLAEWPAARERIRLSGHPTNDGGDDDDDKDAADADDGVDDKDTDDDKDKDAVAGDDDGDKDEPDWKRMARKHEREAKKARAERDATAAKLKEREDADKSDQEKALEAARAEGESAALSKYEEQRRDDKLETETVKLALKEIMIGTGTKAIKARFADADDAHLRLERAIRRGDITYDDIYEDGKVKRDGLSDFLRDLLEENPHLRAQQPNGSNGTEDDLDFDGGKGKGGGGSKDLEEMSPDDHLKAIQNR